MDSQHHIKLSISGGVYLVIDPAMPASILLDKLQDALKGGLQVVQIWNNWLPGADKLTLIGHIKNVCKPYKVPLLINQDWQLMQQTLDIDGVHFDKIPTDLSTIRSVVNRPMLMGITCSGNLDTVTWAHQNGMDYISFCSMFPSASAGTCDIVMPETVKQARQITDIPIFVSGGITPQNTVTLKKQIPFNGVAVISGVLSASNPTEKVQQYQYALNTKL